MIEKGNLVERFVIDYLLIIWICYFVEIDVDGFFCYI